MSAPLTGESVALLQQDYLKRLLESDEMFNNITVLAEDEGNIESQMDQALGIITAKDRANGACVVVRQPNGGDGMPGVLYAPLDLEWDILALEWRDFNKDTTKGGTGKRAWEIARRILRVVKAHRAPGLIQCFTVRNPAISRDSWVREINGVRVPLVGYTVRVAAREADATAYTKVALPVLTGNPALTPGVIYSGAAGTEVTVTCSTGGASIYYTSDLTNPWSGNGSLYTAPVTLAAGTYLFRAFLAGSIGSDSVALTIT